MISRISLFEFSMVPSWAKEDQISKMRGRYVNARDDKLMDSGLWKPRFETQRCLIPVNGFYEPHRYPKEIRVPGGPKPTKSIPFYFKLKSTDHFAFAGLYDSFVNKNLNIKIIILDRLISGQTWELFFTNK